MHYAILTFLSYLCVIALEKNLMLFSETMYRTKSDDKYKKDEILLLQWLILFYIQSSFYQTLQACPFV